MALPDFSMRQLFEAGVAFRPSHPPLEPEDGATTSSAPATTSTSSIWRRPCRCCTARSQASATSLAGGGRVLFVGTKRQAQDPIAEAASAAAQYYVNHRWLGGTLTNWKTISHRSSACASSTRCSTAGEAQASPRRSC